MVRVHVLRGVIASGDRLVAGTIADISESDARILTASGKVIVLPPEPPAPVVVPVVELEPPETEEQPKRQTATRRRRERATL